MSRSGDRRSRDFSRSQVPCDWSPLRFLGRRRSATFKGTTCLGGQVPHRAALAVKMHVQYSPALLLPQRKEIETLKTSYKLCLMSGFWCVKRPEACTIRLASTCPTCTTLSEVIGEAPPTSPTDCTAPRASIMHTSVTEEPDKGETSWTCMNLYHLRPRTCRTHCYNRLK